MRPIHLLAIILIGIASLIPASTQADGSLPKAHANSIQLSPDTTQQDQKLSAAAALFTDVALRWATDDASIAGGDTSRTWTWGPQIFRSAAENYTESPQNTRQVWYLDKARMEVTQPELDADDPWFVTSGLLVRELMSGKLQTGDANYETREVANVPIAGDLDASIDQAITFVDLQPLASLDNDKRAPNRTEFDAVIVEVLTKGGLVAQDERLLQYDVHLRSYDDVLGHNIAHVFTDALSADKLLYIAGRPLTEPYWITASLNRQPTDVLVQAFERRVLTYTPSNQAGWQVEWGNVGRQYAHWRYGNPEDGQPLDPIVALDAKPAIYKLETLSPEAGRIAQERKGMVGVAVLDMRNGEIYSFSGTRSFPMYSTAKVPIMIGVLNKIQREKRAVADWEDSLIRSMIRVSNNDAATRLIIHAGGAAAVNRYLNAIGIQHTVMDNDSWGYSSTTVQDMARLMAKLGNCTILNAELCHYALEVMRDVTPGQSWGVSAGPPDTMSVALKNGWFPEGDGWAVNSMGYVKGKRLRYAIAVYTHPNSSMRYGVDTIEAISTEVYAALK